jgi:hypothetical protein
MSLERCQPRFLVTREMQAVLLATLAVHLMPVLENL